MPDRVRRQRTVTASLAAIVLAVEFVVVVLGALVLFGLRSLPAAAALGGGGAVLVAIVVAAALASAPGRLARAGIVLGWVVQAVLIATLAVDVAVGVVGVLFAGLWTYSMIVGRRTDRRTPPN